MKRKVNGNFRERINDRRYNHIDNMHCSGDNISAPVTNNTKIKILVVLIELFDFIMEIIDV
jgi:hypothetical protein